MAGTLVAIVNEQVGATVWLFAVSPIAAPSFASFVAAPLAETPSDIYRAMPRAFWFWQGIALLVTFRFLGTLARTLRATAKKAMADTPGDASSP